MNIIITGRHLDLTANLKNYAKEKMEKFRKYFNNSSAEAAVKLSVEKYRHRAEVLLRVDGMVMQAESITGEMYSSIDEVTEKLERQIKKHKEKESSHRKGEDKVRVTIESQQTVPSIIRAKPVDIKPMTPEEAAMQLQVLDKNFFVFTNASSGSINVLYKRNDGNLGLIEPTK